MDEGEQPPRMLLLNDVYRYVGMLVLELEMVKRENKQLREELVKLQKAASVDA